MGRGSVPGLTVNPEASSDAGTSEFCTIDRWLTILPGPAEGSIVGPGDDAAVLPSGGALAVSVDASVEGVHFQRSWATAEDIGWRALSSALSDLAAVGAEPCGFLLALSLPEGDFQEPAFVDGVVRGIGEAAQELGSAPILGGDTTRSAAGLHISITVLGRTDRQRGPVLRSGARLGDLVQISGALGWAALGLRQLQNGEKGPERALAAWRRPRARVDLLVSLRQARAAIDLSDGLLADAGHLASASQQGLVFSAEALVDTDLAAEVGEDEAFRLAATGGEDYELLVCAPAPLAGFHTVGRVVGRPRGTEPALAFDDGRALPDGQLGWQHGGGR